MSSYRRKMGFEDPPAGTELRVEKMPGINWYLLWEDCPDNENIVEGWFPTRRAAEIYASDHFWRIKNKSG